MNEEREEISAEFIAKEIARAKTYVAVLYMRGPRDREDPNLLERLQQGHLQHLFALRKQGKLLLNGPALADAEFRGLAIFKSESVDEVRKHIHSDPLIEAGFLVAEVYPWMGLPGDSLS